jgi:hypothetical protein
MSSSARDQCCDLLPTRAIAPFGTCQTVPSTDRTRVVRRLTTSTTPVASPRSTVSPTPYWSSTRMKMPDRKSRTRLCEPNPSATPMIPAPAMSGPRLMPNSPRTMKMATVQIANDARLRSTVDSASTRCVERTLISPVSVSSIDIGVRRRAAPIRSRSPPEARRRRPRRIARRARRLAIAATTRISRIESGLPTTKSAAAASVPSPVESRTRRQRTPGSVPQASVSWRVETAAIGVVGSTSCVHLRERASRARRLRSSTYGRRGAGPPGARDRPPARRMGKVVQSSERAGGQAPGK